MKNFKTMGQLGPKMLRSLFLAILVVIVVGSSTTVVAARHGVVQLQAPLASTSPRQIDPDQPDSSQPDFKQTSPHLLARALPGVYTVPSSCSVPIIPEIVTEAEVQLRQSQAAFAKFIEEQAKLDQAVALTAQRDVLSIEKFRLECEIMVLRAQQQLMTADGTKVAPDLVITPEEVELRKRQFAITNQIDSEEIEAHDAGVASLNRVWFSRRDRIDAEILLLQASVQLQRQNAATTE